MNTRRVNKTLSGIIIFAAGLLSGLPAQAVRVDNLYGATVELPADGSNQLNRGFDRALEQVLVKVTGQAEVGRSARQAGLFPDASGLVQQYSRLPENRLSARFDARAIRDGLDAAGLPVWGENRPLVAVWLAVDEGRGRRVVLSEGADDGSGSADAINIARETVMLAADERGLPIVLPLVDAEDLSIVTFADLWGDFLGPVEEASGRYGAEVILTGRARSLDPDDNRVRWTLLAGGEQASWNGTLAQGPATAAEYLAQRYATYADSAGTLRLLVTQVDTLEKYGELRRYLASLNVVEEAVIARAKGNELEFDLVVRGDVARLRDTLDRSRLIVPSTGQADPLDLGRQPDLVYQWASPPE
jgi:hypothetical protein